MIIYIYIYIWLGALPYRYIPKHFKIIVENLLFSITFAFALILCF